MSLIFPEHDTDRGRDHLGHAWTLEDYSHRPIYFAIVNKDDASKFIENDSVTGSKNSADLLSDLKDPGDNEVNIYNKLVTYECLLLRYRDTLNFVLFFPSISTLHYNLNRTFQ